jgi:hypothetical protein
MHVLARVDLGTHPWAAQLCKLLGAVDLVKETQHLQTDRVGSAAKESQPQRAFGTENSAQERPPTHLFVADDDAVLSWRLVFDDRDLKD